MAGTISVTVLFFASLEEAIGTHRVEISLPETGTRADLMQSLANVVDPAGIDALLDQNVSLAVNQTIETGDLALATGDEVAFLPPITGG